jgi:trehalose/maltose hydrolase-like predicted phosphorylase
MQKRRTRRARHSESMPAIVSPPALHVLKPEFLPAYISNGLMGIRVGPIPLIEGLAVVSGLSAKDPSEHVESFARGPYPLAGDIAINGHMMSRLPDYRHFIEQRYNFSHGELTSQFQFSVDGVTAQCEVLTFCSRSMPSLVLQQLVVKVDGACELSIRSGLDPSGLPGRLVERTVVAEGADVPMVDGALLWETYGGLSRCGAAYWTTFDGGDAAVKQRDEKDSLAPLSTTYLVNARPGRNYVLQHTAALVPSAFHHEPNRQACRLVNIGAHRGLDRLRKENREAWAAIWPARPVLRGATERWQGLVDAAFYYLHASAHPSSLFSTGMFGLAYWPNYHYYRGHVMWDIETFAFPSILIGAPATARAMLNYRFERLPAAQRNAALHGYAGVQFPWESSPERGEEVTPVLGHMLGLEQHVNFSVALAFARFVHATGDQQYLKEKAWPVLREVANWIASRVIRTKRGYEIRDTLGIAEGRKAPVDNNAYVNMAAVTALREAIAAGRALDEDNPDWAEIADQMFIPIDPRRHVIRNHDAFTVREKGDVGGTPEALAGFFPGGYRCEDRLMQDTVRFYLSRLDPYVGSPMLSAPLGVYAAWIGDRKRSASLFEQGYAEFVNEPFRETNETSNTRMPDKPRCSPLFANIGGFLSSLYFGLPRIYIGPGPIDGWCEGEVTMPAAWEGIEVERIWVRGKPARLSAFHGDESARLEIEA